MARVKDSNEIDLLPCLVLLVLVIHFMDWTIKKRYETTAAMEQYAGFVETEEEVE